MRSRIAIPVVALGLLLSATSIAAQERLAPRGGTQPEPPIERLEQVRFERLQAALGLTDEQTRTLRRQVTANREALRLSLERERAAVQALERTLASEPVDEDALQRTLDAVDDARTEMERVRRDQMEGLSRILNPEQRARFLLFNRRFDARLRELIDQRRGQATNAPGIRQDPRRRAPNDRRQ